MKRRIPFDEDDYKYIMVDDSEYDMILECIYSCYMQYTGEEDMDADIYDFNTKLDILLDHIHNNTRSKK